MVLLPPFTFLAKEVMFLVALLCLFFGQQYSLTDWDEILWRGSG